MEKFEVHIHEGGQANFAFDNGQINARQINGSLNQSDIVIKIMEIINGQPYTHIIHDSGKEEYIKASEKDIRNFPQYIIREYKRQLGSRLSGKESNFEIIVKFLNEMENTLQTEKRYDVMPIFTEVPRDEIKGYIYLDEYKIPFDYIDVLHFYWDAYDRYEIDSEYYKLLIVTYDKKLAYIEIGYSLTFADVSRRLYGFTKAKRLVDSSKIFLKLEVENVPIEVDMEVIGEKRDEQIELTNYWIDQMRKIEEIEKHFKIKFHLPEKAAKEEYVAIDAIYNSINKLTNCTLPPIPLKKGMLRKTLKLAEEIPFESADCFASLPLFGYYFQPVAAYITTCTLAWNEKEKAWGTKDGGVPVRVEFVCTIGSNLLI